MNASRAGVAQRAARRTGSGSHTSLRVWLRLLACASLVEGQVRRRLRDAYGITLPRFDVQAQLEAGSRDSVRVLTMRDLSRCLMVTNRNLTQLHVLLGTLRGSIRNAFREDHQA